MRLVDADALKDKVLNWLPSDPCGIAEKEQPIETDIVVSLMMEIESAPTIEPTEEFEWCTDCKEYDQEKHCCHRWTKVIRKTIAEIEEEYKPKRGEWIDKAFDYQCSLCGHRDLKYNFCPNCGADMREREGE